MQLGLHSLGAGNEHLPGALLLAHLEHLLERGDLLLEAGVDRRGHELVLVVGQQGEGLLVELNVLLHRANDDLLQLVLHIEQVVAEHLEDLLACLRVLVAVLLQTHRLAEDQRHEVLPGDLVQVE